MVISLKLNTSKKILFLKTVEFDKRASMHGVDRVGQSDQTKNHQDHDKEGEHLQE